MGYGTDVYSSPEKFDLEILHSLQDDTLSWEFDMLVVWLHKPTGAIYFATDSGCSCPSPFEDYQDLKSLGQPITAENFPAFAEALKGFTVWEGYHEDRVPATEKAAVLHDVMTRLGIYAVQ